MKKFISVSLLALTMCTAACLGACGDDETSSSKEESSVEYVDPSERAAELGAAAIGKMADVFKQDELHVEIRHPRSVYDWCHLEKDANGFYFYRLSDGEVDDWRNINSFKEVWEQVSDVELSENASDVYYDYPVYFFEDGGEYYVQQSDGDVGDIEEATYAELYNYFNVMTCERVAALFNADHFEYYGTYGNRIEMAKKESANLTIGELVVREAIYAFYVDEPKAEIRFSYGEANGNTDSWRIIVSYPENVQEFIDLYTDDAVFENPNENADGFGYDVSKLQALHTEVRGQEHKITLATGYYKFVDKVAAGNYRVKVTSTTDFREKFEEERTTREYEYWNKDGQIKRVYGDEELYFIPETTEVVEKVDDVFVRYTASDDMAGNFKDTAKYYTGGFMHYLEDGIDSYDKDRECFKGLWSDETKEGDTRVWLYDNVGTNSLINVTLNYDSDSAVLKLSYQTDTRGVYDSYTYEFSEFGEVDFTVPTASAPTVENILDEITATDTYTVGYAYGETNSKSSAIIDGEGKAWYGDVDPNGLFIEDGKYYVSVDDYSRTKKYEVSKDVYDEFLPTNNYIFGELFDKANYTASGDGYTYSGKNYDGTATVEGDTIVLTLTENRFPFLNATKFMLSFNVENNVYRSDSETVLAFNEFSLTDFEETVTGEERNFTYRKNNLVDDDKDEVWRIDGNQIKDLYDRYALENGTLYGFYFSRSVSVKYKAEQTLLDDYKATIQAVLNAIGENEKRYTGRYTFVCEDENGKLIEVYARTYDDGHTNYKFTFGDKTDEVISVDEAFDSLGEPNVKNYAKSLEEIKADIDSKNYVYTEGGNVYALEGKNYVKTVTDGMHYYLYSESAEKWYIYEKEFNDSGIFEVTSAEYQGNQFSPAEIISLVNSGLTSTTTSEEERFQDLWYEWENANVTGIDGVTSCKFTYNYEDNSYTISINDGERTITLTELGNVTVETPIDDKMTLFAESMQYNNDFALSVVGKGSQMYANMPDERSALAGATMLELQTKIDADKNIQYTQTTGNPLISQSTTTVLYGVRNGDASKLYTYNNMWAITTQKQELIDGITKGVHDEDIAALLDVSKYTDNGGGTYTMKEGNSIVWQYDYNWMNPESENASKTMEITGVTVKITDSALVITGLCTSWNGFVLDVTFTISNVNSTQVVLPV